MQLQKRLPNEITEKNLKKTLHISSQRIIMKQQPKEEKFL